MKKLWTWVAGAFAILIGLFFMERSRRKQAETQLSNVEYKKEDAVLAEQQKNTSSSISEQKKKIEEIKNAQATQENTENLTPEQIEQFWKNRRDS
jgi:hypothetical protein